jgi:hypothetical protein
MDVSRRILRSRVPGIYAGMTTLLTAKSAKRSQRLERLGVPPAFTSGA